MPLLRQAPDTSLGDTLGRLGSSLGEALNPMNQLRAYDIQQQMWMRQQQVLQLQRENAARQSAIDQFGHLVPPDRMPQITLMIYQGAPWDQIVRQVALASGKLIDANDPVSLQKNIEFMRQIDPNYSYEKDGPPVGGAITAKASNDWKVSQAGATTAAQKAAENTAVNTQAAYLAQGYVDDPSPAGTAHNMANYLAKNGKPWDYTTNGPIVIADKTSALHDKWDALHKGEISQAQTAGVDQANNALLPRDLTKPMEYPGPTGFNGAPAPAPAAPAAPPASTAAPAVQAVQPPAPSPVPGRPLANNSGMVINGWRVTPVPHLAGAAGGLSGYDPGAADAAKNLSETYFKDLTDTYKAGGEPVAKLRDTISQLGALSQLAQTGGVYGQITAGPLRERAKALGLGDITSAQQAQTTMDNLLKTLIPELKSDYNLNRVAQPEIALLSKVTGSADLTPEELGNILANLRTASDLSEALRTQAARPLGLSTDTTPYDYPDYAQFTNDAFSKYGQVAETNRTKYGSITARLEARRGTPQDLTAMQQPGAQPLTPTGTPPDQSTGTPAANPTAGGFDWGNIPSSLAHLFGWGSQTPQAPTPVPAPAPNSRELVPQQDF